ncbi:MAG: hypothetical protein EA422_14280 [Gemmatimonadales bacterium]|nr:MAG: hypothetical protein EA422_14280 [Gemmatimonadales bacterium]
MNVPASPRFHRVPRDLILTAVVAALFLTLASCDDGAPLLFPPAAELELTAPPPSEGTVGSTVSPGLTLRVVDERGNAVPGVPVELQVEAGGGNVSPGTVRSDESGMVQVDRWTLGVAVGANILTARIGELSPVRVEVRANPGMPAQISPEAGTDQIGEVVTPLPESPQVRISDIFGNPVPGLLVQFQPDEGSGEIETPVTFTDQDGRASPGIWRLGPRAGIQTLRMTGQVPAPFTITAEARPAGPATLAKVAGDGQAGPFGEALFRPIEVEVRDIHGNPVPGVAVQFTPSPGSGTVFPSEGLSDGVGRVHTTWTLGPELEDQTLTAILPGLSQVTFSAQGGMDPPASRFTVEYLYLTDVDPRYRAEFEAAARRWEEVIVGDLPAGRLQLDAGRCGSNAPALDRDVDDVLILVTVMDLGNPNVLGQAGPCAVRIDGGLPALGLVQINSARIGSMLENGTLRDVIIHEIGHVLGFGTLWGPQRFDLLRNPSLLLGRGADTHFAGALAIGAFGTIGGDTYTGGEPVPVENELGERGTRDSHWRQSVFQNELMTGFISGGTNPMSVTTIASMADLGYEVDLRVADPYALRFAAHLRDTPGEQHHHHLGDHIYWGPIHIMDLETGRVVRTLEPQGPPLGPRR